MKPITARCGVCGDPVTITTKPIPDDVLCPICTEAVRLAANLVVRGWTLCLQDRVEQQESAA